MAYIDLTYYTNIYKGEAIPTEQFDSLAERASDVIDMLTSYRFKTGNDLSIYPQFIQDQVKKTTAAETEYLYNLGGVSAINGDSAEGISSASIGNFNYSEGSEASSLSREQKMVSPSVISYLIPTGLLYRGVSSIDSSQFRGCGYRVY
ncbi:hypothetical protein ACNRWW_14060 [Metabacillus sp. HB246100]